jgi:hypothetical protein
LKTEEINNMPNIKYSCTEAVKPEGDESKRIWELERENAAGRLPRFWRSNLKPGAGQTIRLFLILLMGIVILAGCGEEPEEDSPTPASEPTAALAETAGGDGAAAGTGALPSFEPHLG